MADMIAAGDQWVSNLTVIMYMYTYKFSSQIRWISRMTSGTIRVLEFREAPKDSHPWSVSLCGFDCDGDMSGEKSGPIHYQRAVFYCHERAADMSGQQVTVFWIVLCCRWIFMGWTETERWRCCFFLNKRLSLSLSVPVCSHEMVCLLQGSCIISYKAVILGQICWAWTCWNLVFEL